LINKSGEFSGIYGRIKSVEGFDNQIALIKTDYTARFINYSGKELFDLYFFNDAEAFDGSCAPVKLYRNGKWGLINRAGVNITDFEYNNLKNLNEGYYRFQVNNQYGVGSLNGEIIIESGFDEVVYVGYNLFKVEDNNMTGYMYRDGTWLWELTE